MFHIKDKLDVNLKNALNIKLYKNYRVLIHCRALQNKIEKKLNIYNCNIIRSIPSIGCICSSVSPSVIEKLIEYPQVDFITFDDYAFLCGNSVTSANKSFFHNKLKLTGKNISIGIVDSGVYPHIDLKKPTNSIIKFLDLINNFNYPYDDNGHGTFISGVIGSSGYSSENKYIGICPKSNIYMIKAFNSTGRGFISDILFSIETLINESKEYNIKVLCLPFEIVNYNKFILSLFSNIFDIAIKNKLTVVVPSGHNGNTENSMAGIALLKNCITVGGIDNITSKKPFIVSSSGPSGKLKKPDLSAACVDICSLNSDTNYISERNGKKLYPRPLSEPYTMYSGTSCAAAYISGICALLYEKNPDLLFKDILSLLKISCTSLDLPNNIQGYGILDLTKLLN